MTKNLHIFLMSAVASASLILTSVTVTAFVIAPDAAYAKNGKGNGGNNGNSGRSKGKDSKANSQAALGAKGTRIPSTNKTTKNQTHKKVHGGKSGKTTLADFGKEFKRDVQQLFGKSKKAKSTRSAGKTQKSYRTASVTLVERSPRPVIRSTTHYPNYEEKKHKRRYRYDPLVAAITDPYGSDKLRNLNASKAATPAFLNAAAHSNVGKIATYQAAANTYYDLRADLYGAKRDLRELNNTYDGRSTAEIVDDIDALDPNDPNYENDLDRLESELDAAETYEEARDDLRGEIRDLSHDTYDALQDAEDAFFDASKGRSLTRDALAEFHRNLDLPAPKTPYKDHVTIQPVPYEPEDYQYVEEPGYPVDGEKKHTRYDDPYKSQRHKNYRDPLAEAITDPYGSDKLRNLNASRAAAPALLNAAPNSNVGKIAAYQTAANTYYDLRAELHETRRSLRDLDENYDGRSSDEIADDIAALDPSDPEYSDKLDALENELQDAEAYEEARSDLRSDIKDLRGETLVAQKEAEYAFFEASRGAILTESSLTVLHGNLGLPQPSD